MTFVVVGSGAMAEHHLRIIQAQPATRAVAIVSRHRERAEALAASTGVTRHETLDEALGAHPEITAVDICHANAGHAPVALASIARGKHVLIEKPVAFTAAEVDAIGDNARARGVVASAVLPKRFSSGIAAAQRALAQMSRPLIVRSVVHIPRAPSYYARPERSSRALAGGGALLYHGIHDLDVLVSLFGAAEAAAGVLANHGHAIEVEDTCLAALRFRDGVVASFEVSTAPSRTPFTRHAVIGGDRMLVFDDARAVSVPLHRRHFVAPLWHLDRVLGRLTRRAIQPGRYADVLHDFVAEVRGERASRTAVATTVESHRIIEKIYAAARS